MKLSTILTSTLAFLSFQLAHAAIATPTTTSSTTTTRNTTSTKQTEPTNGTSPQLTEPQLPTNSSAGIFGAEVNQPNTTTRNDAVQQPPAPIPGGSGYMSKSEAHALQDRTAQDQGASPYDLEITRKIRDILSNRTDMSVNAQNVKVITVDGKVTLRGMVNSLSERSTIESLARDVAGVNSVTSEMKVQ